MLKRRAPATMRSGNDLVAFVIYEGEKDAYAVAFVDLFVVALLNLLPHRPFGFLGARQGRQSPPANFDSRRCPTTWYRGASPARARAWDYYTTEA